MKNIWVPLSAQIAQQRKVETIANNIANANTNGFKKDQLVFKEHLTALTEKGAQNIDLPNKEWSPDDYYRTQNAQNAFVKVDGSYTVFEQGALKPTGNPLDIALNGNGFFEVLTPNGIRFSRISSFNLSKDGELVTSRGYKVLSKLTENENKVETSNDSDIQNRVIKLKPNEKVSISKEGQIFSKSGLVGELSIVEFKDINALRKEGHALFINKSKNNLVRNNISTTTNQGFIEGSNVNAIKEMSELINAHRHFENIQKAIKTYDSISGNAVNDIAKF